MIDPPDTYVKPDGFAYNRCFGCDRHVFYNPDLAAHFYFNESGRPAAPGDAWRRWPLCRYCVERVNRYQERRGLPPVVIRPGAYEPDDPLTKEQESYLRAVSSDELSRRVLWIRHSDSWVDAAVAELDRRAGKGDRLAEHILGEHRREYALDGVA